MVAEIHISATCRISSGTVIKNGITCSTHDRKDMQTFFAGVYEYLATGYNRFYKMDNLSKLGWLAAEVLLKDSPVKENYKPEEVGIILSNANASLDSDMRYLSSVADIASPALFVYTLPNMMTGEIGIRHKFKGEAAFFISENFDTDFTEQYVRGLFDNNKVNACICGWVDVLEGDYKSVLFLTERGAGPIAFTADNMNKVFDQ